MRMSYKSTQTPFYVGIVFLLCVIAIELVFVLLLNNGLLVYTLDDPYIHMALSQNIRNGHYGINTSEFSAPSSSILWPFIIAPFSRHEYFPFLLNVAAAMATVFLFVQILRASFGIINKRMKSLLISATVIVLILATNIIGLPFTGMEHSLQVLLVIFIAYGLIIEIEKNKVNLWFLVAIVTAPLIRYECMAISVAALIYLLLRRHFKHALITIMALIILVGGFSAFLMSLGLEPFPTSVVAKSSVIQSGGRLHFLIANLYDSLFSQRQGIIMSFGALTLILYQFTSQDTKRKQLAAVTVFSVFMHFIAGQYGWYNRYEIYIWSFMLIVILYVFGPKIKESMERRATNFSLGIFAVACLTILNAGNPYTYGLFTLPIAANNIYEQQYQMHRFAVDYYNKPIAVNDLGYVSYKNNNYVLDLWGLGSEKALRYRNNNSNSGAWMREISNEYNIGLVMIYQDWFKHIPEWIKIGKLHLSKRRITAANSEVVFYATNQDAFSDIVKKLHPFIKTLPAGVKFTFSGE